MTRETFRGEFGEPEWKSHPFIAKPTRELAEGEWFKRLVMAVDNPLFQEIQEMSPKRIDELRKMPSLIKAVYEVALSLGMVKILGISDKDIPNEVLEKSILSHNSLLALAYSVNERAAAFAGDVDLIAKSRRLHDQPLEFRDWLTNHFIWRLDLIAVYATLSLAMGQQLHSKPIEHKLAYQEYVIRDLIDKAEQQNNAQGYYTDNIDDLERRGLDDVARYFGLFHLHLRSYIANYVSCLGDLQSKNPEIYNRWTKNFQLAFSKENLVNYDIPTSWSEL